jgi:endonuclease/exonuclease/phosphatase family metal-dependent hydrolase
MMRVRLALSFVRFVGFVMGGLAFATSALAAPTSVNVTSGTTDPVANGNNLFTAISQANAKDYAGADAFKIGTTSATGIALADATDAHRDPVNWGWNDAIGITRTGAAIIFKTTGPQTIRVQRREDGVAIDQIVLSPDAGSFLNTRPGGSHNDTRIIAKQSGSAGGTLIAYDGFNYTVPGNLNGNNGGSGFANAWTAINTNPALASGSMTHTVGAQMLGTTGNKLQPALNSRSSPNFTSTIMTANTTKWVSFRMNHTGTGAFPTNHAGFGLYSATGGTGTEIFLGKPGGSDNYGFFHSGTTWDLSQPVTTTGNRDALLVYKLVFTASNVTISMWVNPPSLASGAAMGSATLSASKAHATNIASMNVSTGANALNFQLDEFRMGNSFADVVPAPPHNENNQLDIMVWNIYRGRTTDLSSGSKDVYRHASCAGTANVDVICFQEYPIQSPHRENLRNHLRAVTGVDWHEVYIGTTTSAGEDEGNAVLSRYPLTSTQYTQWLAHSAQGGRSIAHATINYKGTPINIFSTHLDSGDNPTSRGQQVNDILGIAGPAAEPKLICGDFNMTSGASQLDPIQAQYHDDWLVGIAASPDISFGYPDNPVGTNTRTHVNRIDYVWRSMSSGMTMLSARVIDTRDPLTYQTNPSGPTNSQGDLLAIGLTSDSVLNTKDDKWIRASDHNMQIYSYDDP